MTNDKGAKGHIVLTVKDLEKSYKWYLEIFSFLGFDIVYKDKKQVYFGADNFPIYIALFQGKKEFDSDSFNRYRIGFHHFAIAVESKEKVDEFYKFLISKKVVIADAPKNYPEYDDEIYYAVFFNDPDSLRLEVFYEKN